jgi:HEAT repeat protein
MEPFAVFAIATLVVGTLLGRFLLKIRPDQSAWEAHLGAWKDAARACDLEEVDAGSGLSLTGHSGPLHVRLDVYGEGHEQGTRIRVSGLLPGLTIRPQGLGDALSGLRGVREVVLEDDAFDEAAWVRGDPTQVRALLDHECRRVLRTLFEGRLEHDGASTLWVTGRVDGGELLLHAPTSVTTRRSPEDDPVHVTSLHLMPHVLRAGLSLARRLLPLDDPALRLAENMAREPVAEVRLRTLDVLLEEHSGHSATREALLAAGEDPSATVRFRAALALGGRKGRDILVDLARGHGADDATTARAVEALGRSLTTPEAEELLREALRTRREATALACMAALGRRGTAGATPILARVLAVEKESLAEAAAEALGENGDPGAERPLLQALEEGSAEVQVAAARALGRVGTVAAVAPLRRAETGSGAVRPAARQAIAEIQARLAGTAGASAGQLSLSAGQSGQVSLTDDATGRVSLPESPETAPADGDEEQ